MFQELRLKNIDEKRYYFYEEIKQKNWWVENQKVFI